MNLKTEARMDLFRDAVQTHFFSEISNALAAFASRHPQDRERILFELLSVLGRFRHWFEENPEQHNYRYEGAVGFLFDCIETNPFCRDNGVGPDIYLKLDIQKAFLKADRLVFSTVKQDTLDVVKDLKLNLATLLAFRRQLHLPEQRMGEQVGVSSYVEEYYNYFVADNLNQVLKNFCLIYDNQREPGPREEVGEAYHVLRRFLPKEEAERQEILRRLKRTYDLAREILLHFATLQGEDSALSDRHAAAAGLARIVIDSQTMGLIEDDLMEEILVLLWFNNSPINVKLLLAKHIIHHFLHGKYPGRMVALALMFLSPPEAMNGQCDSEEPGEKQGLGAFLDPLKTDKSGFLIRIFEELLIYLKEMLLRVWEDESFSPPLPLVLYAEESFSRLAGYYLGNLNRHKGVNPSLLMDENSFIYIFIYKFEKHTGQLVLHEGRLKRYRKVLSRKYQKMSLRVPALYAEQVYPELYARKEQFFIDPEQSILTLRTGVEGTHGDAAALAVYARQDILNWLQITYTSPSGRS